ncbi:hypothetical protein OH735_03920 [Streptomyces sp. NBC_01618]|nr:hypothetical protein OH735_03920 [Streptomyces sp. NBC_01618]
MTKVTITYRPRGSVSLGSFPDGGPKRRHPLHPVRGPGHDPHQGTLRHPRLDLLLQPLRRRPLTVSPKRLQRRDARLRIDDQTLVLRIPGIRRGGGAAQFVLQLPAKELCVEFGALARLGEADLHQVGPQHLLDDLPGQQLLGPVGVLLRADHRDVAGAQFLGERGEDHRLEVLAHELPGTGLVDHRLAPVLGGEGDVDLLAFLVEGGDVLAAGRLVPLGVREGVQHPTVLADRGELQLVVIGQVEHHRSVPADLAVQQHFPEVAVVGGDLLDLLVLLREPSEAVHREGNRAEPAGLHHLGLRQGEDRQGDPALQPRRDLVHRRLFVQAIQGLAGFGGHGRGLRERLLGRAALVDVLEHRAVVPDQGLDDLPLGEPDLLQLRLGLLDLRRHALAEHRRQVVPHPHPRLVRQSGDQRDALDGDEVPQLRGVRRVRLSSEVGDLPRGDSVHPHVGVAELVQPVQTPGQVFEVRPGRALGGLLQPVEQRRPVAVTVFQQPHEPRPLSGAHAVVDARADRGVDLGADFRGHLVEGREPGQLQPGLHHLLQRDVDQIRRAVLRRGLLADRPLDDPPGLGLVVRHAGLLADQAPVMLGGPLRPVHRQRALRQLHRPPYEVHHHLRDVLKRGETPHTPVRLQHQHQQQRQQMLIAVRGIGRPLQLIAARGEEQMQLMRGDQPLEPRIRGPFNRCHNPPQAPDDAQHHHQRHCAEWVTGDEHSGLQDHPVAPLPRISVTHARGLRRTG